MTEGKETSYKSNERQGRIMRDEKKGWIIITNREVSERERKKKIGKREKRDRQTISINSKNLYKILFFSYICGKIKV